MRVKGSILADNITEGISGINFTDGVNTYTNKSELNFNDADFYLTSDSTGNPVLNRDQMFEGCLALMDTNNSLVTNVQEALTFNQEVYDITKFGSGWFDSASSAINFVVPKSVNFVVAYIRALVAITGTPATIAEAFGSFITLVVTKNGAAIPQTGTAHRTMMNATTTTMTFTTGPLPVVEGDTIQLLITATFPGAGITAVSVTAANTYGGVYKVG